MDPPFAELSRELPGRHTAPLYDMQLFVRTNGVHAAWFHDAYLSGTGSARDIEDVYQHARMLRSLLPGYVVPLRVQMTGFRLGFLRVNPSRM